MSRSNAAAALLFRRKGDGSTLNLDFTGGSLDPRVVLTRSANTATYINSSGYVTTAMANEARFDYDPTTLAAKGLLIEGSAINLFTYSADYTNAAWSKGDITATAASGTSPENVNTAVSIFENGTAYAEHILQQSRAVSTGNVYTFSLWAKEPTSNSRRYLIMQIADGQATAARFTINIDLQAGTILTTGTINGIAGAPTGTASSITAYGNGWYRCTVTMNCIGGTAYIASKLNNGATLNGNGISQYYIASSPFKGVLIWGAQFEIGTNASSYIATVASQVTRNPDLALMTSTNFSSWFTGGTTGTFFVDWHGGVRGITSTVRSVISTSDQTTKHLHLQQVSAAGALKIADFGAANSVSTANSITSGARTKGAFSFAYPGTGTTSTVNLCLNGGTVATSSAIAFSVAPTWLVLGGSSTDGSTLTDLTTVLNGSIRQIKYYPTALTSAQLIAMST
jgi:hypothetical protein